MTALESKAYARGARMGEYIKNRDGIAKAIERGSKSGFVYSRKALADAYNRGYFDMVNA